MKNSNDQKIKKFNEIESKYKNDEKTIKFLKATWIFSRGSFCAKQGKLQKAITDFEEAIKIKNDYIPAYFSLCVAYMELGEKEKAKEISNKFPDEMRGKTKTLLRKKDFLKSFKNKFNL